MNSALLHVCMHVFEEHVRSHTYTSNTHAWALGSQALGRPMLQGRELGPRERGYPIQAQYLKT